MNILYKNWFTWPLHFTDFEFENFEILGHPVMIWDVMDYFIKKVKEELDNNRYFGKYAGVNEKIIILFFDKMRLPIEEQSDECIDFIYNLINE